MAEEYEYNKPRKQFGRYPMFEDTDSKIVGSIPPSNKTDDYVQRDPNSVILDNIPLMSEHRINTERVVTNNRGMRHTVGGWPREFDHTEAADLAKYQKRMVREP